jgi:hypothetical protein
MPIHILATGWAEGISSIPFGWLLVRVVPVLAVLYLLKWFFNGAVNTSERNMHSKVVMMTVKHILSYYKPPIHGDYMLILSAGRHIRHRR